MAMNTPDPNNPQPGDRFLNTIGVTWEVRAIDGADVWVINPDNGARCTTTLGSVATWTPVTPTPPDTYVTVDKDGDCRCLRGTADAAADLALNLGHTVARYTFAEWVTP